MDTVVVVVIDALGYEIAKRHRFGEGLLSEAVPLETVLGYSSAAIPSLLTGRKPSQLGIWSMYRYDPVASPFKAARWLRFLPLRFHPRLRVLLKEKIATSGMIAGYFDLYDIPLRYLPLFSLACPWDAYRPGFPPAPTLFDEVDRRAIPWKGWDYRTKEAESFSALCEACSGSYRFLFLYTAALDSLMHRVGTRSERVSAKLSFYERWLERIMDRLAGAGKRAALFVVSDHGMNDVNVTIDLGRELAKKGFRLGRDYLAFFDATMARFWPRRVREATLVEALTSIDRGMVLSREELERLGCLFPDGSYGEVVFLADPGTMIVPSFVSSSPLAAMHGYHPSHRDTKAMVASNYPGAGSAGSILDMKKVILECLEGEQSGGNH